MQNQLICSGCRRVLLYPRGASNVCCAVCNSITSVSTAGTDMARIVCGGCQTLLMYTRGATNVRCSCCNVISSARAANQVARVTCGQCYTTLVYPYGASSVECAVCHHITDIRTNHTRESVPRLRPNGSASASLLPPVRVDARTEMVVVENPSSVDERGKLVSNVVIGVTTGRK